MLYKPPVIFYFTGYCPHCKRFYELVLKPYVLRNEIFIIKVDVERMRAVGRIKGESTHLIRQQETCYHQEYMFSGDHVPGGHGVPAVKIIPPYRVGVYDGHEEGVFISSYGEESDFFRMVRKEIDRWVMRRAHIRG